LSKLPRLAVENLACAKGERLLFQGLGFTVESGAGLVVTGPNGIGKTSLLRILAGLAQPTAGSVRLESGQPDKTVGQQSHFYGGKDGLKNALTVSEQIRFWCRFNGQPDPSAPAMADMLARLLLTHQADLPISVLSAGQRRRLGFGQLLFFPRPVWLLDEPMNALDPDMRQRFMGRNLALHMASGGIAIASTHIALDVPHMRELAFAHDGAFTLGEAAAGQAPTAHGSRHGLQ
jgi:heme exporter protein A